MGSILMSATRKIPVSFLVRDYARPAPDVAPSQDYTSTMSVYFLTPSPQYIAVVEPL